MAIPFLLGRQRVLKRCDQPFPFASDGVFLLRKRPDFRDQVKGRQTSGQIVLLAKVEVVSSNLISRSIWR